LAELQSLEVELHSSGARGNQKRRDTLLHADFLEIGRSGQHDSKAEILHSLALAAGSTAVGSGNFARQVLRPGIALLT
jgi:hypothetical protein